MDLHSAIRTFVATTSFEMTAADLTTLAAARPWLASGTVVSITWLPNDTHDARVAAARALTDAGLIALPHIAARRVTDAAELDRLLGRLVDEAGVRRAFLIAGDVESVQGTFDSSRQLLETGLFERRGFQSLGIAGYPEGHPRIGPDVLATELRSKLTLARHAGLQIEVITQFCFEAEPIRGWLGTLRRDFPQVDVRIGLAGPAHFRTLIRFARICGLGASARALFNHGGSLTRLLTEAGPDPIIRDLMSDALARSPRNRLHLFPFGGLERTARWAAAVRSGDFSLPAGESGFRVSV